MGISTLGPVVKARIPYTNESGSINLSFEATTLVPEASGMTIRNDGKVQVATSSVPGVFVGVVKVRNTATNMRVTLVTPFIAVMRIKPTVDVTCGDPIKFTGLDTEQTGTPATAGQWAQAVALESCADTDEFFLVGVYPTPFKVDSGYTS